MEKQWIEPKDVSVPEELQIAVGGHPLVAQMLTRRGINRVEQARAFLDPDHYQPTSPFELPGMARAVERLERAIQHGESIWVWGDFDVDGQTATALLVSTLRELGAQVSYHIPIREKESHGVNLPVLKEIIQAGAQLLLTCDTGIAAHEAVAYAHAQGIDVIISDHHDLPDQLPEAHAIVNPKLLNTSHEIRHHPLATLPGVGVAYKIAEALCEREDRPQATEKHLDLVALGIVADIALQIADARYLLQRGLESLRSPHRLGLQEMMTLADLNPEFLTEEHIGFVLGPRLNALGRLSDANLAVEFLTTEDQGRARVLATQLEGLNAQRQLLTNQVFQAAQAQLQRDPSLLDYAALVLAHPHWPAGVIGIVASQLVEYYHKPVVLIATPPGGLGRGSARSIEGINITAAIASQAHLLERFGGHPMAAGMAITPEKVGEFRAGLSEAVAELMGPEIVEPRIEVDAYLSLTDLTLELVDDLERLAPFGPGNPALTLASKNLNLTNYSTVGRNGEHRRLIVEDEQGNRQNVIWWDGSKWPLPEGKFDLAYLVRASDFRGQRDVQVEWLEAKPAEETAVTVTRKAVTVVDYRGRAQPLLSLKNIPDEKLQVWCEGEAYHKLAELGVDARHRYDLSPGSALAIWTTPPGPQELQEALDLVSPEKVYLFGFDPETTSLQGFLMRLSGLVKYALTTKRGRVKLSELATETAQRKEAVRKGLAWLAAKRYIRWLEDNDQIILHEGGIDEDPMASAGASKISDQLKVILKETSAYRDYFGRGEAENRINPRVEN